MNTRAGLLLLMAMAIGCGDAGGGDLDATEGTPNVGGTGGDASSLEGVLLNGPVSGVAYETDTQAGVTDADGVFRYRAGEAVVFRIGGTVLGEVQGKAEVTPFDLAGIDAPPTNPDLSAVFEPEFQHAVNVAILLQTFDFDGDSTNGIEVTSEVASLFEGREIDLAQRWFDLTRDAGFRRVLGEANEGALLSERRRYRNPALAIAAVYDGIGADPMVFAETERRRDDGADSIIDSVSTRSYDEDGVFDRPLYR